MRTLTEILKDAHNAKNLEELNYFRLEVIDNDFSKSEMEIAKEILDNLNLKLWKPIPEGFPMIDFNNPAMLDNTEKVINPEMLRKSPIQYPIEELNKSFSHMILGWNQNNKLAEITNKIISELNKALRPTFWQRAKQAWKVLIGK